MNRSPSPRFLRAACAVAAVAGMVLAGCGSSQLTIEQAVNATRTADKLNADTLATALAATLAAMQPTSAPASLPTQPVAPQAATETPSPKVCTENMADLKFLSSGYLEGGRFLITLQKPQGPKAQFQAQAYTLLVNGSPFTCTLVGGNMFRIYCTGGYVPPAGQIPVQLLSADSSCTYDIPFGTVPIIPPPVPTSSGKY